MRSITITTLVWLGVLAAPAQADTVLYAQDFEHPTGFVNDGGDVNIFKPVNDLYGNQPPGFGFEQTFTVETLLVGGTQAWGHGFQDPQGRAGQHVVSLLSTAQDDWLALSFNVGSEKFLNFQLDISSIDLDRWGGPFVPPGEAPVYRFTLYDNPGGARGLGSGTPLSTVDATGTVAPNPYTFDWKNVGVGLSTAGNTNGNVILRVDLLSGGYAAMDNFKITAAATPLPEPGSWPLALVGAGLVGWWMKSRRRVG